MQKILIVFFTIMVSVSCSNNKSQTTITIAVPSTISAVPLLTLNQKTVNGKKIEVIFYQDHILAMAEFINGKSDIIMTGFTQGAAHYKEDHSIVHLATPVWGVSSLIASDPTITSLAALSGKKIAVPFQGSPLDIQVGYITKSMGLTTIEREYLPIQQAAALLSAKKIDAIAVPEPVASKLVASGRGTRVATFAALWAEVNGGEPKSPQVSLFIHKKFADKNRKFIGDFLSELKVIVTDLEKDPHPYSVQYAKTFELPKEICEAALRNTLFDLPAQDKMADICAEYLKKTDFVAQPDKGFYYQ